MKDSDSHIGHETIAFVPQDRGREETIAWLDAGTSESLVALLTERDQAARQVRRGPKTKGTREVQLILNKPSRKTVEKLHRVRRQAEMALRYGTPGVVMYKFSKSLGWNRASGSRVPSLQLSVSLLRGPRVRVPAVPPSPINWLVLPTLKTPQISECGYKDEAREQWARSSSPVSEPGGWRDTEQMDTPNPRPDLTHVPPSGGGERDFVPGEEEHEEDEGAYDPYNTNDVPSTPSESCATAIKVIPLSASQTRERNLPTKTYLRRPTYEDLRVRAGKWSRALATQTYVRRPTRTKTYLRRPT
ncbi:hypothetical protein CHU98_g12069, partial [Xylaria longipes]